jgi:hypothetical protein
MRFVAVLLTVLMALSACQDESPSNALTADGLGKVKIGMTFAEAEKALGTALKPRDETQVPQCYYTSHADEAEAGVIYMLENAGTITRIDVKSNSTIRSTAGIGIGSTEAEIHAAYGDGVIVQPHKYLGEDSHYLSIDSADHSHAILFETDKGVVTTFRAGVHPSVAYVEGCL